MPWLAHVPAVLEAWYPAQEDGDAVANVLFGDVNPSGKLPVTFPASLNDTFGHDPMQYPGNHRDVKYSEGIAVGYRWFQQGQTKPLFPFGFGLSYTSFRYADLHIYPSPKNGAPEVTIMLTNIGPRAGTEIVQLYLGFPPIEEGNEPERQLRAFCKVALQPGESKRVTLLMNSAALLYWSEQSNRWKQPSGDFRVMVGASSEDIRLHGEF